MKAPAVCWMWIAIAPLYSQSLGEGIAAVDGGRFDQAVRILSTVVERDATSADANFYLGLAHFRAGHPAEARGPLERAVTLAPQNAQAWKMLGLATTSAGSLDAATEPLGRGVCARAQRRRVLLLFRPQSLRAGKIRGRARTLRTGIASRAGSGGGKSAPRDRR